MIIRTKKQLADYLESKGWKVVLSKHMAHAGRVMRENTRIEATKGKRKILIKESDIAGDAIKKYGPPMNAERKRWQLKKPKRKTRPLLPIM